MYIFVTQGVLEIWLKRKNIIFLKFSHFTQFSIVISAFFLQKCKIWKTNFFMNFVVSLKVIELQRCTIPHFKALDLLFWPLAWLFTLGLVIFAVWQKTFVNFFFLTLYVFNLVSWNCLIPIIPTPKVKADYKYWFLNK